MHANHVIDLTIDFGINAYIITAKFMSCQNTLKTFSYACIRKKVFLLHGNCSIGEF